MKRLTYLLPTMIAAAFLLPNLAAAKPVDVKGPLAIAGKGFLKGDLKMENAAESRPFVYEVRAGYIGVLDNKGDLRVRCQGFEETEIQQTDEGKVYFCMGERGRALVQGSSFTFRAFGVGYRALIPEGTSGQLAGRFVQCTKPADNAAPDADNARLCGRPGGADAPKGDRPGDRPGDRGNGPGNNGNGPGNSGNGPGNSGNGPGSGNNGNGPGSGNNGNGPGSGNNGNGNGGSLDNLPSLAELAALLTAKK